jgi:hypothetical protein
MKSKAFKKIKFAIVIGILLFSPLFFNTFPAQNLAYGWFDRVVNFKSSHFQHIYSPLLIEIVVRDSERENGC